MNTHVDPVRRLWRGRRSLLPCALAALLCALACAAGAPAGADAAAPPAGDGAARPAADVAPPHLSVTGADLMVAGSGQQLYSVDPDAQHEIASTTKLMTALITLQHVSNLNTVFAQMHWRPQADDSQIGLLPGEKMTVHDLLLALMIPSADDAAMDLAYNVGGHSVKRFVAMMNAEARALGLAHTHYTSPSGLDTPGNHSGAEDLSKLADYDMHYSPFLRWVVSLQSATLESGRYVRHVVTTDSLLAKEPWIDGIKTGHTSEAGYVLVSEGTRDGLTLIATVMGTASEESRDDNALALLDYGFDEFHNVAPVRNGEVMARLPVAWSDSRAAVSVVGSYTAVLPRSDSVKVALKLPRQLTGPIRRQAVVGHARVLVDGRQVAVLPVRLDRALPSVSFITKVGRVLGRSSTLVVLALIAFAIAAAAAGMGIRRRRPRKVMAGRARQR